MIGAPATGLRSVRSLSRPYRELMRASRASARLLPFPPGFREAPCRHGDGGLQLLGEERDAEFLDQPAERIAFRRRRLSLRAHGSPERVFHAGHFPLRLQVAGRIL